MLYVLAVPELDPATAVRLGAFRARHEPHRAALVPPHVTLVFGVAARFLPDVSRRLDAVSREFGALPVAFDRPVTKFDPFENKYKIFLLCGTGQGTVMAMHHALYDGPHRAEFSAAHPFKPHMTIATCDTRAAIDRVDVSDIGALPIAARLSALRLVRFEDGRLETVKTAPLTG